MINTAQIRAARGLLKWTQAALAHRAAISTVTLNMIENETVRPRETTLAAIRRALEPQRSRELTHFCSWKRTQQVRMSLWSGGLIGL
jgi:DNA-binding XRE family transcriptional regulator